MATVRHADGTTITTNSPTGAAHSAAPLSVATWNIAAVNNNPFEYWITHDDAAYNQLMDDVQAFIDAPGEQDVAVDTVFTPEMFAQLAEDMAGVGMDGVEAVSAMWEADYRRRKIISGFMKDKEIGSKRLASMPDRITNTINTLDEGVVCRPTIINCYNERMDTVAEWWEQWRQFHFHREVLVKSKKDKGKKPVWSMLQKIAREKYPAISPEEEAVSIPLQLLCGAIFDATLVHMLNTVAPGKWFPLKQAICESLMSRKQDLLLGIVESHYAKLDVLFLQEVAGVFVDQASSHPTLADAFHFMTPELLDGAPTEPAPIGRSLPPPRCPAAAVSEAGAACVWRREARSELDHPAVAAAVGCLGRGGADGHSARSAGPGPPTLGGGGRPVCAAGEGPHGRGLHARLVPRRHERHGDDPAGAGSARRREQHRLPADRGDRRQHIPAGDEKAAAGGGVPRLLWRGGAFDLLG
jgi:hypothetical protein